MSLQSLVDELVDDRSLDALQRLTGSRNEDVLEALIDAVGRILGAERSDPSDDEILDEVRQHLVDSKPIGLLVDALQAQNPDTQEFALRCLGEIGDMRAFSPMVGMLESKDERMRKAAASHLSLLTHYDFGSDPTKWRAWQSRRLKGLEEQAEEDREDQARMMRLQMRGNNKKNKTEQR